MAIGDAFIDVHANMGPFDREIDSGLDRIADDAEQGLDKTGKSFGKKISDSMVGDLGRRGKQYGKAIEDATKNVIIKVRSKLDFRNVFRRNRTTGIGDRLVEEVEEAFIRAAGPRGPFSKIGQGIADAIGSGFNVSGRSPLIAVLLPALLALFGVIVAAIQAVNALVALLVTIPALITAIGLQIGVVALAFNGVGEAIQGAFAAKNAKELNAALKGLTPSAQSFVKSLLPLKGLFKDLKALAQENLFKALGDSVAKIFVNIGPTLRRGVASLATSLGTFFKQLADFFASPMFVTFVRDVFPSTAKFLAQFGPAFVTLLEGLIAAANAALPFLNDVGSLLSGAFQQLGYFLQNAANDPAFQQWLNDMYETLKSVVGLFNVLVGFVTVFLDELNKAGGKSVIDELTRAFEMLIFFLSSPLGQKAMEGLINLAIIGIKSFTGLLLVILSIVAVMEVAGEAIRAFVEFAVGGIQRLIQWFVDLWTRVNRLSKVNTDAMIRNVAAIPGRIVAMFGNLGGVLFNAGRSLLTGFINGIKSQFGALRAAASAAIAAVAGFFPHSPAEFGPLSGSGAPFDRGQKMMEDFAQGMKSETPTLRTASMEATSNVVFGPNSIQMQFHGPVPNQTQARSIGSAMGNGAADMIAARNTRLAVRTL